MGNVPLFHINYTDSSLLMLCQLLFTVFTEKKIELIQQNVNRDVYFLLGTCFSDYLNKQMKIPSPLSAHCNTPSQEKAEELN